jgi:hypothetical protein
VESSCELGNEPSGSIKMLRTYRVAAQIAASRVVLSSTESTAALMKFSGALGWKRYVPPKRRFLEETHGATSQKTAFCSHCSENLKTYTEGSLPRSQEPSSAPIRSIQDPL